MVLLVIQSDYNLMTHFIIILCLIKHILASQNIEAQLASIDKTIRTKSNNIVSLPLHKKYSLKF